MLRVVLTGIFDQSGIQVDGCTSSQSAQDTLSHRAVPPCTHTIVACHAPQRRSECAQQHHVRGLCLVRLRVEMLSLLLEMPPNAHQMRSTSRCRCCQEIEEIDWLRTLAGWITSDAIALSAPPPTLILYLHTSTLTTFPTLPSHRYSNNNNSTWQRQRLQQQHRAKSLRSLYIGQSVVFPSLLSAI